jgi:carboxyl-terminal processing protease
MTDSTPPDLRPTGPGPALALAAVLLLVAAFSTGLVVGQSGSLRPTATDGPTPNSSVSPAAVGTPPASAVPSGVPTATPGSSPGATPAGTPADFGLFWEALDTIRQQFVGRDELADRDLTYGAIRGLVESLGDTGHSIFLTPDELRDERRSLDGSFVGIGALLGVKDGRPVVVSVFADSPAQQAGVRPGDEIIEVDGQDVQRLDPATVAARVRGEEGTTVNLLVGRPSTGERLALSIVRRELVIPVVSWTMVPGTRIGLLRLIQFSSGSSEQLGAARDAAVAQGAQALILDLRSNPGGIVPEAIDVASLFLEGQTVFVRELADGQRIPVATNPSVSSTDLPLVVLIDGGTASSAEIVAGAIRSAGRAELVGETTFGTGTVLNEFELSDGSAIRLAVERWLTPDGEVIFDRGIDPSQPVELEAEELPIEPDQLRDVDPAALPAIGDAQLLRAIELLGGDR